MKFFNQIKNVLGDVKWTLYYVVLERESFVRHFNFHAYKNFCIKESFHMIDVSRHSIKP